VRDIDRDREVHRRTRRTEQCDRDRQDDIDLAFIDAERFRTFDHSGERGERTLRRDGNRVRRDRRADKRRERLAAADPRIRAVAGLAPVTDWRALSEFAAVKERPEIKALALDNWAAELAGRAVFLAIGNADARVGSNCCVRLALRILEEEARRDVAPSLLELHVVLSEGHSLSDDWRSAGRRFLLQLAQ